MGTALAVMVMLLIYFLGSSTSGRMNRTFEPGAYLDGRRRELDATDVMPNRSESKNGKTRAIVLFLLRNGRVVQDVIEFDGSIGQSNLQQARVILVWSKTARSQGETYSFPVAEDGSSLFHL